MEEAEIGRLMSELNLKPTMQSVRRMSVLPPKADTIAEAVEVHLWPEAVIRSSRRRERPQVHSGSPAFRNPSISSFAFDRPS